MSLINITFDLPLNINIADIIRSRAETYGYNEPFYIGDKAIRIIYTNDTERIINEFSKCECKICPYAIKDRHNNVIQYKKKMYI